MKRRLQAKQKRIILTARHKTQESFFEFEPKVQDLLLEGIADRDEKIVMVNLIDDYLRGMIRLCDNN